MQQIINFILRYRNTVLYLLLTFLGIFMTVRSHSYHQSKFFNSSKWLTGGLYQTSNDISTYFGLRGENQKLAEENERLRKLLFNNSFNPVSEPDSLYGFNVMAGRAVKNSYVLSRNYLTIDLGRKQGVTQDMGVITSKGILGIVENTSRNYSTVQSILNSRSNINAKIKNTNYFGSLVWNGERYDDVQLIDIPRLVPLVVGDTIVTGGMSSIFPENIPIGTIKKYELDASQNFYTIDVGLFNDMTNINTVYVIESINREEILQLQSETETNEQ